jgi:cell division protein FtsB
MLKRSIRNYIALMGFKSRFLTWLGYESWFGRVALHGILYALAGKRNK